MDFSTKWILLAICFVDAVLLCGFFLFRFKRGKTRPSSGCFDFDQYKERELLRRGLLDRGKW